MYQTEHPLRYIFRLTVAHPKWYQALPQQARFSGFGLGKVEVRLLRLRLSWVQVRLRLG